MSINFFAKTNFRNQETVFGIKEDDRRRHVYVIGKTGMGKSNLMENMAIQDIRNGKGVCFIDPHGEGAEKLMRSVPSDRINDVVYLNPADTDFPIAFNILESVDDDKKNLVASGMMGVFKKIWPDVWSPRMEYILNNTILALLDYPGSTMLGVNRMMSDKEFRKRIYPKIKDPIVKSFWLNEFEKWEDKFRKEAVAAIQNKVGQFLSSSLIRHIIGQPKSTIDMREIMDNEKILIVNLSKGRIGEDAMRLLGGMIVTKIQLAAMGRVDMPEDERKDFYLYVDEFQNFVTESFANILSEARKYRLCLTLGHQYINQLVFDGNSTVRDAIFGNVGTMIVFRVGAEDAEFLEKEFDPVFTMNDLVNLSKYNMYLKLMIDGVTGDAFSAVSLPPADLSDTIVNEEKVIKVSRERYGRARAEVEEKIARWSGMLSADEFEKLSLSAEASSLSNNMPLVSENKRNNNSKPEGNRLNKINPSNSVSVKRDFSSSQQQDKKPQAKNQRKRSDWGNQEPRPVSDEGNKKINLSEEKRNNLEKKEVKKKEEIKDKNVGETKNIIDPQEENDSNSNSSSDRPMFEAICSTCEEKIAVPFNPDPTRPTFCKECLKDYQRAKAKAQNELAVPNNKNQSKTQEMPENKNLVGADSELAPLAYIPKEKPMSLSQISHMSPKKFKNQKKNLNLDLGEIRNLIKRSKNKDNENI